MIGFPFDSHVTYDSQGNPSYDRAITSEPYRALLKKLFSTGVMPNPSTNMQVTSTEGMAVKVKSGFAMVEGLMKLEENDKTLIIETADSTYDRIDTIVLRLNDNESVRSCEYAIIKGTASSSPVVPSLTRSNSIYDIGLANVRVKSNSTAISQANITDTRYDADRCGIVSSISEFDTTTLYDQIQADLEEFRSDYESQMTTWTIEQQAEFIAWVDTIKDILDETTAGHLQNEIDELKKIVHITVEYDSSLAGATITATNGTETYNVIASSTGKTVIHGTTLGTWEVSESTYGSSSSVNAYYYGNYSTSIGGDRFINVTVASDFVGKTITCTNGSKTQSKVASTTSVQFCFAEDGTFTISGVVEGATYTTSVVVSGAGTYTANLQTTITLNLTVYSGVSDTVYYYENNDTSTSPITLCTTDTTGKAENVSLTVLPNTDITFYSTIAKDTTSGSSAYSKSVTINENVTELRLMPNGVIYWYGFTNYQWSQVPSPSCNANLTMATNSVTGKTDSNNRGMQTTAKISYHENIKANVNGTVYSVPPYTEYSQVIGQDSYALLILISTMWRIVFTTTPNNLGGDKMTNLRQQTVSQGTTVNFYALWFE